MVKISELNPTQFPSLRFEVPASLEGESVKLSIQQIRDLMQFTANEIGAEGDTTVQAVLSLLGTLKADISYVDEGDNALGQALNAAVTTLTDLINQKDADQTSALSAALVDVLRHSKQVLTPAQKGQVFANISAENLSGFRNQLINPDFSINQRGSRNLAPSENLIVLDRWYVTNNTDQVVGVSAQPFPLGQTDVPGEPSFYLNLNFPVAPKSGTIGITQRIEGVRTLAGKRASVIFYTSGPATNGGSLTCSLGQNFGTGGSPSASVISPVPLNIQKMYDASTRRRHGVVDLPSLTGKTIGTATSGYLAFALTLTPRASGNYSIAHTSVVAGEAIAEFDPFAARHEQQELSLCRRYYENGKASLSGYAVAGNGIFYRPFFQTPKARTPLVQYGNISTVNASVFDVREVDPLSFLWYAEASSSGGVVWQGNWTADAEI